MGRKTKEPRRVNFKRVRRYRQMTIEIKPRFNGIRQGWGFLSSSETSFHSSLRIFKIENISIAMYALRKCGEPETSGGGRK